MKRIDKLTESQKARFDEWADKWIEIGLRTGPADRPRFEAAAKKCYESAGIPWHNNVVWITSPIAMAIAAPVSALLIQMRRNISGKNAVGDAVHDAVGIAVDGAVHGAVDGAVHDAVGDAVGDAVHGAVGIAVDGAVRGAVDGAVGGAVGGAMDDAVKKSSTHIRKQINEVIKNGWSNYLGGQFWPGGYWWGGAFTSFFREICGLELNGDLWERGKAYEETIQSACWWYPHKDFLMVCERPTVIMREQIDPMKPRGFGSHRLHCQDGPAVGFKDGWGVFAWHGVLIPREWIEQKGYLTPEKALGCENVEQRRAACEILGWPKILDKLNAKLIDQHENPQIGTLYEVDLPDSPKERFLRVMCGTDREFAINVDRECKTAMQAQAWIWQDEDYNPEIRT